MASPTTDDPLLQARNFSYLDTQLTRLGGPNFDQLPINRPHSPVNTHCHEGLHVVEKLFSGLAPIPLYRRWRACSNPSSWRPG